MLYRKFKLHIISDQYFNWAEWGAVGGGGGGMMQGSSEAKGGLQNML